MQSRLSSEILSTLKNNYFWVDLLFKAYQEEGYNNIDNFIENICNKDIFFVFELPYDKCVAILKNNKFIQELISFLKTEEGMHKFSQNFSANQLNVLIGIVKDEETLLYLIQKFYVSLSFLQYTLSLITLPEYNSKNKILNYNLNKMLKFLIDDIYIISYQWDIDNWIKYKQKIKKVINLITRNNFYSYFSDNNIKKLFENELTSIDTLLSLDLSEQQQFKLKELKTILSL